MTDDSISRSELYEALDCGYGLDFSELPETKAALLEMIANFPSAEPEWIPVTEQTLPKHNSVVVVCGNKGTWDYGTYRGHTPSNINLWNWKKNTLREVHWWMYKEDALPKPWKGEDDAEIH